MRRTCFAERRRLLKPTRQQCIYLFHSLLFSKLRITDIHFKISEVALLEK